MANNDKELFKFINDPKYRNTVLTRMQKETDAEYKKRIKIIENEIDRLSKARVREINKITNSRWEKIAGGIEVNQTEGKIIINNSEVPFSYVKGAELNMISGDRIITTDKSKSKKHASIGGALAGTIVTLNPIGTIAGGIGLGKKTTTGKSVTNQIPTCSHLGVVVDIDGFKSEIVLLSTQVDKRNILFTTAEKKAQQLISQLATISRTPVPQSYHRPEEEPSVISLESQIALNQDELQKVLGDAPTYKIPEVYIVPEQADMSDSEYLEYLKDQDEMRASEKATTESTIKQADSDRRDVKNRAYLDRKESDKQRKLELNATKAQEREVVEARKPQAVEGRRQRKEQFGKKIDVNSSSKKIGSIISKIMLWTLSLFFVLSSLVSFSTDGGVLSGIVFILTGSLINPLITKWISEKFLVLPKWGIALVLVFGFFVGALTFPTLN